MTPIPSTVSPRQALTYRGEALRALALPLGGIGTGSVALAGDGGLRQWQIVNNVNHDAHVPNSFFAIWAGGWPPLGRGAVVLQCDALYDEAGFQPAPSVSDHLVPPASRQLLAELPGVDSLEVAAQYPIVEVGYTSSILPVTVSLEAFSPFIPLNSRDSGFPAVLFRFTVRNPNAGPVAVSLLGAQQNLVGWDGKTQIEGVRNLGYGGNINSLTCLPGLATLDMRNVRLDADHPANGNLALAVFHKPSDEVSSMLQWESPSQLWDYFGRPRGVLPNHASRGESPDGQTWNGALALHFALEPGAERTVTFVLAWYFPNRYVTWDQEGVGVHDRRSRFWIGNAYCNVFTGALDVVQRLQADQERLVAETRRFRDLFFASSLPWEVLESAAAPVSTLRTPTCLWTADGRLYGFEGCHGASTFHGALEGCCPMNCTHVWNYEMALAKLFPDLEQSMRRTDLIEQISPWGSIPHRTALPLYLPRPWTEFIGGPRNPAMDGELGTILKTYRELRHGAGRDWFDEMWPPVKRLMAHVMNDYDSEHDGVVRGEQPNTYDISIYGPNTFIGTLYLAALRACEEMARLQGETELADDCRARFELGRQNIDRLCWNGEYYSQIVDMAAFTEQQFGIGCHIDQLLGQWWAFALDLGYVLPEEHVRATLRSIFRFNRRESFRIEDQTPRVYMDERDRGLYICTWPHGDKPAVPTQYSDEVWSGLEYPLAAMLWHVGERESALTVLADIRERHNGTRRSPWNEVECGDHYVRPLASWTLFEEASGYCYDAFHGRLAIAPPRSADFRTFWIAGSGWGEFVQTAGGVELRVDYGSLALGELRVAADRAPDAVTAAGRPLSPASERSGSELLLRFAEPLLLTAGESLAARFDP